MRNQKNIFKALIREEPEKLNRKQTGKLGTMAHACNPSTLEVGGKTIQSSRPAWAACDPVSKQNKGLAIE